MPMTIRTGLAKKIGLRDYGSLGATCEVTFEADHNLLDRDLEGFQQRVKNAFTACRQAVQDELARQQQAESATSSNGPTASANGPNGNAQANGNGHANDNGHHNGTTGHAASEKQLASMDASGLIDTLKSIKDGDIDLSQVLEGSTP